MHSKKRIILWSVIATVLLAGIISIFCLLFNRPFQLTQPTFIYIDGDDTADSVYVKIQHDLHGKHLAGFRMLSRFKSYDKHIHTGAYRFDAQTNTLTLFRRLSSGHQTPVKVTIPSVRTLDRLAHSLDRQLMADSTEIFTLMCDSSFCDSLGFTYETLPALFIPNTYEVYWNMQAKDFFQRMKKEYNRFWNEERKAKAKAAGLTPVEVSTLASIVEEETANRGRDAHGGRTLSEPSASRYAAASRPYREIQLTGIRPASHPPQAFGGRQPLQHLQAYRTSSRPHPHCFYSGHRKRVESCTT